MVKNKQSSPYRCDRCSLLMMIVRVPDPAVGISAHGLNRRVGWQCPFWGHTTTQYTRVHIPTHHTPFTFPRSGIGVMARRHA